MLPPSPLLLASVFACCEIRDMSTYQLVNVCQMCRLAWGITTYCLRLERTEALYWQMQGNGNGAETGVKIAVIGLHLWKARKQYFCWEKFDENEQTLERGKCRTKKEKGRYKETNQRLVYNHVIFAYGHMTWMRCKMRCLSFYLVQHPPRRLLPLRIITVYLKMGCFDSVILIRYW